MSSQCFFADSLRFNKIKLTFINNSTNTFSRVKKKNLITMPRKTTFENG